MRSAERRHHGCANLLALTCAAFLVHPAHAEIRLAEVVPGSYLQIAGLRAGDQIERYEQTVDGHQRAGAIDDPLGLATVQVFRMALGPVDLIGHRGAQARRWHIHAQPDTRWFFSAELPLPAAWRARFANALTQLGRDHPPAHTIHDADAAIDKARDRAGHAWAAWMANLAAGAAAADAPIAHFRQISFDDAAAVQATDAITLFHLDYAKMDARHGQWPAAFAQCQAALDALTHARAAHSQQAADANYLLGAMYARRGEAQLAFPRLARAEALYAELAPDYWQRAVNAIEQGALANTMHDRDAAVGYYERAATVFRAGDPHGHWVLNALTSLAIVEDHRGNLKRSHALLVQAAPLLASMPDGQLKPSILRNFAAIESDRGDFAAAEKHLYEAIDIGARFPRNDGLPNSAVCDLAELLRTRGDLNEALRQSQRCVVSDMRYAPHSSNTALSLLIRARVERDIGLIDNAVTDARQALEIQRALAGGKAYSAEPLVSLAEVESGRAHYAKARELIDAARNIVVETHAQNTREDGIVAHADGMLRLAQGDLEGAQTSLRRALSLSRKFSPDSVYLAQIQHDVGLALLARNETVAGRNALCAAAEILEHQIGRIGGGGDDRGRFVSRSRAIVFDCADARIRDGDLTTAFQTIERGRARGLLQLMNERSLEFADAHGNKLRDQRSRVDASYDEAAAALADLPDTTDAAAQRKLLVERLARLRDRRADLTRRLREVSPRLATLTDPRPLDIRSGAAALDPGSVLVDYLIGTTHGWIFVVPAGDPAKLRVYPIDRSEQQLRAQVEQLRTLIAAHDPQQLHDLQLLAARLYAVVLQPAEAQLSGADHVLVAADGPLNLLPFVALRRSSAQHTTYLIDWKPFTQIASITIFAEAKARRNDAAHLHERVVAFGDPDYAASDAALLADNRARPFGARGISPLPATRHEVETLAALYPHTREYLGGDATESAVKAAASGASILHLATHGYFDPHVPLDSGLLFAAPAAMTPGHDNGYLQTWEILESVRTSADLVTLSACDTALGEQADGEGLLGLTRAFEFAGAHSVLASLWNVSDDSTSTLMQRFYRALAAGASKDEALRAAQLALLRGTDTTQPHAAARGLRIVDVSASPALTSHPYYWAGFQLYGDWR
ncbi:MAG: CHAT domain-containing protein [Rudaea sp.]